MGNAAPDLVWTEPLNAVCLFFFSRHIKCCVLFNQTAIVIVTAQTGLPVMWCYSCIFEFANSTMKQIIGERQMKWAEAVLESDWRVFLFLKTANRRGEKDGQCRGQSRETAGGRGETDYSHTLITMSSPTLTGPRLGHNTNTWDLPMAEWTAALANGRSAEIR